MANLFDIIKTFRPRRTILSDDFNDLNNALKATFDSLGTKATGGLLGVDSPFKVGDPTNAHHAARYEQIQQILAASRLAGHQYVNDADHVCTEDLGEDIYMYLNATPRTVTLPANPANGETKIIRDANHVFGTTNCTVARNGKTINNVAQDLTLNLTGSVTKLIYSTNLNNWIVLGVGRQIDRY